MLALIFLASTRTSVIFGSKLQMFKGKRGNPFKANMDFCFSVKSTVLLLTVVAFHSHLVADTTGVPSSTVSASSPRPGSSPVSDSLCVS